MQVPEATPKRYALGMSFQTIGRLGHLAASLLSLMVIADELPVETVGLFSSYLALFALLDILVDGGSGMALLRRAAARTDALPTVLDEALRFRWITAGLGFGLSLVYLGLDPEIDFGNPWAWACALTLFGHLPGAYGSIYHLQLRFALPALLRSGLQILAFFAIAIAVASGARDPMLFVFFTLSARVVANLILQVFVLRSGALTQATMETEPPASSASPAASGSSTAAARQSGAVQGTKSFARESLVLGLGGLFREGYGRMDILLLRWFFGSETAGLYAPARETLRYALLLPNYLLSVAIPPLAALAEREATQFHARIRRLARNMSLFAIPAALISLPLAPAYLSSFFDPQYVASADALRLLAGAAAAAWPGMVFLTAVITCARAHAALWISGAGFVLCGLLSVILIPLSPFIGAATARLATEGLMLALAFSYSRKLARPLATS